MPHWTSAQTCVFSPLDFLYCAVCGQHINHTLMHHDMTYMQGSVYNRLEFFLAWNKGTNTSGRLFFILSLTWPEISLCLRCTVHLLHVYWRLQGSECTIRTVHELCLWLKVQHPPPRILAIFIPPTLPEKICYSPFHIFSQPFMRRWKWFFFTPLHKIVLSLRHQYPTPRTPCSFLVYKKGREHQVDVCLRTV